MTMYIYRNIDGLDVIYILYIASLLAILKGEKQDVEDETPLV